MRLSGSLTYQRTRRTGWGFQSQSSPLSITLFPWFHQALPAAVCLHSELVWGCCYSPHGHNSHTLIPALACSQQIHLGPVPPPREPACPLQNPTNYTQAAHRCVTGRNPSAEQKPGCRAAPQWQCRCVQKEAIPAVFVPSGLMKAAALLWASVTLTPTCRSFCGGHETHGPCSPCWRNLVLQADVVTPSPAPHSCSVVNPLVLRKPQVNSFSCYKMINGVSETGSVVTH